MAYKQPDLNNPVDVRRATDRLYHRLKRLGYRLQHGRTEIPGDRHIQLKKIPIQRGYRISDIATGKIVLGDGFSADYQQVYEFWERAVARYLTEKRKAEAQKQREVTEKAMKREWYNAK